MKKFLALPIAAASVLGLAVPAFADTTVSTCPPGQFGGLCNLSFSGGLIGNLITFAFVIAIVLALAWLIYGGIRWILSQGDKGKVDSARQHIIAALIGLIIVFLSYFLLNIVLTFFGISGGIRSLQIPNITSSEGAHGGQPCGGPDNIACIDGQSCLGSTSSTLGKCPAEKTGGACETGAGATECESGTCQASNTCQ